MPAKTKARDLVKDWPRGKSTSAFNERRYFESWAGFRYRIMYLPWQDPTKPGTRGPINAPGDWSQSTVIEDDFRRTTEHALESEYRAGQQKMLDDYRARYRTLTPEDRAWLRYGCYSNLQDAVKEALRSELRKCPSDPPFGLILTIKQAAENDETFGHRFRIARV